MTFTTNPHFFSFLTESSCWHLWLNSLENQMNHVNRVFKCLFSVAKSWIAWCKCLPLPISWCLLRLFTTLETNCNDNISLEINLNHSSSWYSTLFLKWQFSITLHYNVSWWVFHWHLKSYMHDWTTRQLNVPLVQYIRLYRLRE